MLLKGMRLQISPSGWPGVGTKKYGRKYFVKYEIVAITKFIASPHICENVIIIERFAKVRKQEISSHPWAIAVHNLA